MEPVFNPPMSNSIGKELVGTQGLTADEKLTLMKVFAISKALSFDNYKTYKSRPLSLQRHRSGKNLDMALHCSTMSVIYRDRTAERGVLL